MPAINPSAFKDWSVPIQGAYQRLPSTMETLSTFAGERPEELKQLNKLVAGYSTIYPFVDSYAEGLADNAYKIMGTPPKAPKLTNVASEEMENLLFDKYLQDSLEADTKAQLFKRMPPARQAMIKAIPTGIRILRAAGPALGAASIAADLGYGIYNRFKNFNDLRELATPEPDSYNE